MASAQELAPDTRSVSERLNQKCFCLTLDRDALRRAMAREMGGEEACAKLIETRPHLFSNSPVFISERETAEMLRVVRGIEEVSLLPAYREAVFAWAPEIAREDFGPRGVFMGYDFHLEAAGPRLIEVNSNAGGGFLNAALAKAQRACCAETDVAKLKADDFDGAVLRMFAQEWKLQRRVGGPRRIAIVDETPAEQYLYPEFLLAQRLFRKNGIEAVITDPRELRYEQGRLLLAGNAIDLVYNRLVDFSFDRPETAALRAAYLDGTVVVTPNPNVHALYADKRNLTLLSDAPRLCDLGALPAALAALAAVPRTVEVSPANAEELWRGRKHLFFKPFGGHGGKAVYCGDKVTKRIWEEILSGGYVAQDFAPPGERAIMVDGRVEQRKADVRLFTYDGEILLTAARLYQGQVTNFRTPGGGFAPVFAL
jgi:hypothetical protein